MPVPDGTRVLVLNDDYVPMNTVHWKKAMKRLFESPCERCKQRGWVTISGQRKTCNYCQGTGILPPAIPVEYFDAGYSVRDGRGNKHLVPAVIANAHHVHRKYRKVPYSKVNVLRRDGFRCQFCGTQMPAHELTLDHVVPRSMWNGCDTPTCWTNIVAACRKCNLKKANRTPEQASMPLKKLIRGRWVNYKKPKVPTSQEISLGLTYRRIPDEWELYVAPFRRSSQAS
jgi:5-methylcytosine-specific restriction endonuclease McrA